MRSSFLYGGVDYVEMESDCLQVIRMLRAQEVSFSSLTLVIKDILSLMNKFKCIKWLHVN